MARFEARLCWSIWHLRRRILFFFLDARKPYWYGYLAGITEEVFDALSGENENSQLYPSLVGSELSIMVKKFSPTLYMFLPLLFLFQLEVKSFFLVRTLFATNIFMNYQKSLNEATAILSTIHSQRSNLEMSSFNVSIFHLLYLSSLQCVCQKIRSFCLDSFNNCSVQKPRIFSCSVHGEVFIS